MAALRLERAVAAASVTHGWGGGAGKISATLGSGLGASAGAGEGASASADRLASGNVSGESTVASGGGGSTGASATASADQMASGNGGSAVVSDGRDQHASTQRALFRERRALYELPTLTATIANNAKTGVCDFDAPFDVEKGDLDTLDPAMERVLAAVDASMRHVSRVLDAVCARSGDATFNDTFDRAESALDGGAIRNDTLDRAESAVNGDDIRNATFKCAERALHTCHAAASVRRRLLSGRLKWTQSLQPQQHWAAVHSLWLVSHRVDSLVYAATVGAAVRRCELSAKTAAASAASASSSSSLSSSSLGLGGNGGADGNECEPALRTDAQSSSSSSSSEFAFATSSLPSAEMLDLVCAAPTLLESWLVSFAAAEIAAVQPVFVTSAAMTTFNGLICARALAAIDSGACVCWGVGCRQSSVAPSIPNIFTN